MRHTHDTTFSEKIIDVYKILEKRTVFHFIFKENGKSDVNHTFASVLLVMIQNI
jgi:hypothetical protein